jgi:hypothetical protein
MLVKSLVIATAAALLAPTIGIAAFFVANSDNFSGQATMITVSARKLGPMTELVQAETIRTFAPQGLWFDPAASVVQEPKTIAARTTPDPAAWHTVVSCPEGQALAEDGRCPAPKIESSSIQPPS